MRKILTYFRINSGNGYWTAWFEDSPTIYEYGNTLQEAVGKLVLENQATFNMTLTCSDTPHQVS